MRPGSGTLGLPTRNSQIRRHPAMISFRPKFLRGFTRVSVLAAFAALPFLFPPVAPAQSDIPIGVVMHITGREARPGQYQREGIALAMKEINDGGGIYIKSLKKKLKVREVFYDDGSDQARSSSLSERVMTSDNVIAMIGGYSTALGEAESVMPRSEEHTSE